MNNARYSLLSTETVSLAVCMAFGTPGVMRITGYSFVTVAGTLSAILVAIMVWGKCEG